MVSFEKFCIHTDFFDCIFCKIITPWGTKPELRIGAIT